ncbi:activating transcription factor 7-interacting protein 1-like isoform X1 [Penaeus japonicus]|uniref:activating transcription factor 7-interacting protein 1-like isoform X1 n=1 Tax=Penaeus japonicus TaxID=27405 RepID=UPI001C70E089|nr:activating transcription factor 7-interacting protein 1-like isoform X1 [Penaeus japonicus]XP_042887582.1 activating transcription factor 7-interacting protein 1-like isoform X1 [Penaeus japonicus]XP_042887586.1 activating transcription factor 7-interacting protein 1-like isoform X1 [Penaeus japonicus]XP_042887596.1 activating transcription factor 7-interacting protein 1-like isoform X1 [Penaeus japonicus]XP_042887603.1 activating transcription factor 7-interacting protein 1-like isoform X1 
MKAMDQAAPMITVPAGVLKEFMSPANSRTPTPPATASVANSALSKSSTPTPAASSNSRTPSPALPSSSETASASLHLDKSSTESPAVVSLTNGDINSDSSPQDDDSKMENDNSDTSLTESSRAVDEKASVDGASEGVVNGTGVKRPSDEDNELKKPDLKKIRVFAPAEEDGFKKGDISIAVQEFNQHLDKASKKLEEAVKSDLDTAKSDSYNSANTFYKDEKANYTIQPPANNNVRNYDVEVISSPSKDIEVLPVIPSDKDKDSLIPVPVEKPSVQEKESKHMKKKLQRLSRKELENMIMRLFSEKLLYQTELGKMKQLCERSESTLETNRKKTAQFHKEVEDLRKVTNRLSAEHAARKGQYVAPIRIKRSVGIQASPHIINKGILHANGSAGVIKTIAPRPSALVGVGNASSPVRPATVQSTDTRKQSIPPPNVTFNTQMIPTSSSTNSVVSGGPVGLLASSQGISNIATNASLSTVTNPVASIGTVRPSGGQMLMVAQPGMMQTIPRASGAGVVSKTTSAVIPMAQRRVVHASLGNRVAATRPAGLGPTPGTLVKVPVTGTTQLVAIPQAGQVVLLPPVSGGQPTTALVVSNVSSGVQSLHSMTTPAVAQSRIGPAGGSTSSGARVVGSVVHSSTTTTSSSSSQQLRHPAPLPKTPFQQVGGITKKLPPQPTLKLSHKDNSIVLSWTMGKTEDHETIASYQLYAYQEGTAAPSALLWKKVGSVKALELPMACTLTQFMPGHVYHFAVRAVDIKSRLGPFSEPRSIRLDK